MSANAGNRVDRAVLAAGVWLAATVALGASALAGLPAVRMASDNTVPLCVTPDRLMDFVRVRNSRLAKRYDRLARHYARHGNQLGVRWDIAFFQMMVETANLTFRRPDGEAGDVAADDNNLAGLGAVGDGRPGETFETLEHGVRAHLEHVLHYAGAAIRQPVAERTRKVQAWNILAPWHQGFDRPITFSDLALRWAPHSRAYLESIEYLAARFQARYCAGETVLLDRRTRAPEIAATAWRFEQKDGKAGMAGTVPPTGKPDFAAARIATLGAANVLPPLPTAGPGRFAMPPRQTPRATPSRTASLHPGAMVAALPRVPEPSRRPSQARPPPSKDDRIRALLNGRKVLLNTHVGATIPIFFAANGRMQGNAGGLGFFLGASSDQGRWWAANGKLCQKWQVWLDRETHCMKLKHRGEMIWWQADDGKSGTARIVAN